MFAIAEFGSRSRLKDDEYSDHDILIVVEEKFINNIKNSGVLNSCNITLLTPIQLEQMKFKGSLFLMHLKKDARIIFDQDYALFNFLKSCQLIKPSFENLEISKKTISYIESLPSLDYINNFKADFLFCCSRDFIIKDFAAKNVLVFGTDEIVENLIKFYDINQSDINIFLYLRKIKTNYRNNENIANVDFYVKKWINILKKIYFISSYHVKFESIKDLMIELKNKKYSSNYERLRTLEMLYIIYQRLNENFVFDKEIINIIKSPNLYGSTKKNNIKKIDFLNRILINLILLES